MQKIDNLSKIYRQLKDNNKTYTFFPFIANGVNFDIFFDINKSPFKLVFLALNSNFQLSLDVLPGFLINNNLPKNRFYELVKLLNLKKDINNPFSTTNFFKQFDNQIPQNLIKIDKQHANSLILKVYSDIEEKDKIYYLRMKDWNDSDNEWHRTSKNLEKTRLLYPDLYSLIVDKDISIYYTSDAKQEKQIPKSL
ncbi:hypothetical protein IUY40_02670 [Flavobacterium sp. ALJ2]|uniref:DUF6037 family protein n=1 Tax=Flavobacterium sp. ALJ2 TaxID=2786960 RepID=UPI0018A014E7|nr:DUF6037 family protein [Flavobacterium sp. ALJ2]MBF7090448.1 hypothetical protein [Flavobacterium sp. ALJ2]